MMRAIGFGVLLTLAVLGCGSGSSSSAPKAFDGPTFPLKMTAVTVPVGGEQYLCWSYKLDAAAAFPVVGTQANLPKAGVHHYAVFTNSNPVPASPNAYDCKVMDGSWGLIAGGGVGTPGFNFPSGVAMTLAAGTHVVFQLHLINTTQAPLPIDGASIDLLGSTEKGLTEAGLLIAGNLTIDIPPHAMDVKINGGCAAPNDLKNIFAVFPHMHTLGTHIALSVTKQGASDPDMLLDRGWDFGNQGVYAATGSAVKGDKVGVTCTFSNTGDKDVHFGETTSDEMCLGVLYYYPAVTQSQYCFADGP
jgi:hypothetical protein